MHLLERQGAHVSTAVFPFIPVALLVSLCDSFKFVFARSGWPQGEALVAACRVARGEFREKGPRRISSASASTRPDAGRKQGRRRGFKGDGISSTTFAGLFHGDEVAIR